MRRAAVAVAGLLAVAAPALDAAGAGTRANDAIPLAAPVRNVDPLAGASALGLRKDRLLTSVVPGPVRNTEDLTVSVGPDGAPAAVEDVQQLVLHGSGAYIVRELGP
ncbi:MAG TPA: hypothetical protein VFH66_10200, partial [Mycobacteriales bacterium]|nr:hypothetical protein [Mycobacteriales bacterium]